MVDLLLDQTRRWQAVEAMAREHFRRAGIEEIRTSAEVTELFVRGICEGTDVVGKEMYSFLDRGERCTLRKQGGSVLCGGAARVAQSGSPEALHGGPMFRLSASAGRQRQFHRSVGVLSGVRKTWR